MGEIAKLETFRKELAIAETYDEIKLIGDASEAYARLMKKQKVSTEAQNRIADFIIEVEAKKGEWLEENHPHGARKFQGNQYEGGEVPNENLTRMPASKHESTRARTIAKAIKEAPELVEDIKERIKSEGKVVTPNLLFYEVKKEEREKSKTDKARDINNSDYKSFDGIILGDCIKNISNIKDESIDCLITDPPYGIDIQFNKYDNELSRRIENDGNINTATELLNDMLSAVSLKLKYDAHIYIFCTWKVFPEFKNVVEKYHQIKNVIVWNKKLMGMGDLKYNYADTYELIIFAGGQREFIKRPSNIIEMRFNDERFHNTQKPVSLIEQLIENSTSIGEVIFDPFLGSGSTAIAAINKKRKICGFEIDEQNYKITLKRLNDVV